MIASSLVLRGRPWGGTFTTMRLDTTRSVQAGEGATAAECTLVAVAEPGLVAVPEPGLVAVAAPWTANVFVLVTLAWASVTVIVSLVVGLATTVVFPLLTPLENALSLLAGGTSPELSDQVGEPL